ncbi:hypothetical protein PSE305_02850 [Pseudomonas aeruginosa]|nr:hypothetical protein BH78_06165 [Pseudomonas aeruginosa C1913C]KEA27164.1 hypothetical protein BH77_02930 [Pseudomonas aeruginosa C2773C]KXC69528.1 hypothetical protein AW894_05975 [Pseudomonas aeruginosa]KXC82824.1 hypothetical protein AW896_05975 [Pseudomonas aeruginosa]CDO79412.1 hypothetical protein PSE305_02850 [Pseudomonas aeruginosa]
MPQFHGVFPFLNRVALPQSCRIFLENSGLFFSPSRYALEQICWSVLFNLAARTSFGISGYRRSSTSSCSAVQVSRMQRSSRLLNLRRARTRAS